VYSLVKRGHHVRATYRDVSAKERVRKIALFYDDEFTGFDTCVEWVRADITDLDELSEVFNGVTRVYNCTGNVSFDNSDWQQMIDVNVRGTSNIVNLSLKYKVQKLVHVSSIAALGESYGGRAIDEDCLWVRRKHESWYSITKFNGEAEVWRAQAEGLSVVVVNPSVILGPGHWFSGSPSITYRLCHRQWFYPGGSTGVVDVRDVTRVMIQLMESDVENQRFVVSGHNVSFKTLFSEFAACAGVTPPTIKASPMMLGILWRVEKIRSLVMFSRPVITRGASKTLSATYTYSNEKIRSCLGLDFTSLEDTVSMVVRLYQRDKQIL
jgi:nucleoside-diphosphate-sugar epimerase